MGLLPTCDIPVILNDRVVLEDGTLSYPEPCDKEATPFWYVFMYVFMFTYKHINLFFI